jgi:hypothetical protein
MQVSKMEGGKYLSKNNLIIDSLRKFYRNPENMAKVLPLISQSHRQSIGPSGDRVSLRIIDWFVTNYAKKNNISYFITGQPGSRQFIVYLNYKAQLKAYSKKQFDPFCRRERIEFPYNDKGDTITTTIGQLNFFRWAIDNYVLNYIYENVDSIERDMNTNLKASNASRSSGACSADATPATSADATPKKTRKKRQELSVSATKSLKKHEGSITLSFD